MENNDVSSANSFTVDIMLTGRLLMYIRNRVDPKWILAVHLIIPVTTLISDRSVQLSGTCLSKTFNKF